MRFPRLVLPLLAFTAALFTAAIPAHADTYSITSIENDNHAFYGMDDQGHVVFTFLGNYYSYLGITSTPPAIAYDFTKAACVSSATPICSTTDNGRTVSAQVESNHLTDDLLVSIGGNPPQLIGTTEGIAGFLVINGTGDIVFDNGISDEWFEAIDLTPTPEPASFLLLATGALACGLPAFRRRQLSTIN